MICPRDLLFDEETIEIRVSWKSVGKSSMIKWADKYSGNILIYESQV